MNKTALSNPATSKTGIKNEPELPGYPIYPPSEDVFGQLERVDETSIEEETEIQLPFEKDLLERPNSPDFTDGSADERELNPSTEELDVPGSELDDAQEQIGNEDEENNYYSLGGDNHDD